VSAALKLLPNLRLSWDSTFFSASKASLSITLPPYVATISRYSGPFSGGVELCVKGRRFGTSAADIVGVTMGEYDCINVRWISKTELLLVTPAIPAPELPRTQQKEKKGAGESESAPSTHCRYPIDSIATCILFDVQV
jgi:hypothetical protein